MPSAEISCSLLAGGFRIAALGVAVGEEVTTRGEVVGVGVATSGVGVGDEVTTAWGVLMVVVGEGFAWVEEFLVWLQPMRISKKLVTRILLGFIRLT